MVVREEIQTSDPPVTPPPSSKQPGERGRLLKLVLVVAGLLLLAVLLLKSGIAVDVLFQVQQPLYLVPAAALIVLEILLLAARLQALLRAQGRDAPLREALSIELMNRFFSLYLPLKLNVPLKAALLQRLGRASLADGLALSSVEVVLDTAAAFLLGFVALPLVLPGLRPFALSWILPLLAGCLVLLLFAPERWWEAVTARASPAHSRGRLRRLFQFLLDVRYTWRRMFRSRHLGMAVVWLAAIQFNAAVIMQLLFFSAGVSLSFLPALVLSRAALLAGNVTQIPGGLGAREAAMVVLFSPLGVPAAVSLYASLASRVLVLLPAILGYLLSLRLGVKWVERAPEQ